jgi:hypothetical protein
MGFHRTLRERELEAGGMDARDAAIAARAAFGSGALAVERARDVWIPLWLQDLGRDFRFAARLLVKERAFTAVVVIVLGLGIGVANLQFVLIDAICIRGLPIPQVDMASHGNGGHGGNGITQRRRETEILLVQIVVGLRYSVSLCDPVISVTSVLVTSVTSVHSYREDDSLPAGLSGIPNAYSALPPATTMYWRPSS